MFVFTVTTSSTFSGAMEARWAVTVLPATLKTLYDLLLATGTAKTTDHVGQEPELLLVVLPPLQLLHVT